MTAELTNINSQVILSGTGVIPAGAKAIGFYCLSGTVSLTYEGKTFALDASQVTASGVLNFEEEIGKRYGAFAYDASAGTFQYADRR